MVKAGFNHGMSFLLNQVQQRSDGVERLCTLVEEATGFPANANLYLTPAGGVAFETHFDWMDVLVLQLHGQKRWRLYPPLVR